MAALRLLAVLLLMLGVTWAAAAPGSCPPVCFCPLDARGRRQVVCTTGGLLDPLPVLDMPADMEVLEVGAPQDRPNKLTLGPIFKGHRRLESISVTESGVPALGAHSFWGLRRLHTLNVSHNAITAVLDTNFRGADGLLTLDLSHNRVESVPSAVFRHVKSLRRLSLAHNRLPDLVPRVLYGLTSLAILDLSHNPLGVLPHDRFIDTPALQELHCSGCGIQEISSRLLEVLPQLRLLDLRQNRLTELPTVSESRLLSKLHLDSNHVSSLESGAVSGPPLDTLTLAHNRLSTLEPHAFINSSLSTLDLSYNRLTRLRADAVSEGFGKLRRLKLSGNPLRAENLVQVVPRSRQLRHLDLGDLKLTQMPSDLLRHSRHLKSLNMSSNLLSEFPTAALFATPHLTTLDLSHNNFRGLPEDLVTAFTAMASLERVWLQGNPWQCYRCRVASMVEWLQTTAHQPHSQTVCRRQPASNRCLKCFGPSQLAGRDLQMLERLNLPDCEAESTSWTSWLGDRQQDDPRPPRHHPELDAELREEGRGGLDLFGEHLALVVGVGCGLVLALLLVVAAALLLARRHSALYYTHEPAESDSAQKLMSRNNNDNSPHGSRSPPRAPTPPPRTHMHTPRAIREPSSTQVSIATIEEVDSIAGSSIDLQTGRQELRAPRIVRLAASPLP